LATADADTPEPDELWRFSLAFYAVPGVAQALLGLQDREGLDVNLMLFALWIGVSGRGWLDRDGLLTADQATSRMRADVVQPLRALRQALKGNPDIEVQRLREEVKALELAAEKRVLARLAGCAARPPGKSFSAARLTAADANLVLYLGPERARGAEVTVIRQSLETFVRGL
jgi:uncharacterized protein (TIGR02444 family)